MSSAKITSFDAPTSAYRSFKQVDLPDYSRSETTVPTDTIVNIAPHGTTHVRPSLAASLMPHEALTGTAKFANKSLFPGNAGKLDYSYLDGKVAKHAKGYEPMSPDVKHYQIETPLGSTVGAHVYPASVRVNGTEPEVVIFSHGNIRPSRYMNDLLEQLAGNVRINGAWLPENRKRTVIARDFVGYDLSSKVENKDGGMELAAIANDRAVVQWAADRYATNPDTKITVAGRSIGTGGWVNQLTHPRVTRALGFVPFAEPAPLLQTFGVSLAKNAGLPWPMPQTLGALMGSVSLPALVADLAFPRGHAPAELDWEGLTTKGFAANEYIKTYGEAGLLSGKNIWLFPASRDELVPAADVGILQKALEGAGCSVHVETVEGTHTALPGDGLANAVAMEKLQQEFFHTVVPK